MKKIKWIILLLVILIIVIIFILFVRNNSFTSGESTGNIIDGIAEEKGAFLEREKTNGIYFFIDDICNNLFEYINHKNENIDNKQVLYSILAEEFIDDNNITEDNVLDVFSNFLDYSSYRTKEVYTAAANQGGVEDARNVYIYAFGILRKDGNDYNVYFLIKEDFQNETYNIQIIDKEQYNKAVNDGINNESLELNFEIPNKEYNKIYMVSSSEYDICLKHMEDYKNALLNNPEEAYNMLDEEYRNKRFGSFDEFNKYREEKQETYGKENFTEYLVNYYEDYTEYVCKDMYGNLYIFQEKYPMDYSLKLDTYTLMTEKFKNEYDNGSTQTKVQLNIDKFILMINNQDYKNAYNLLDETFRDNYFKTIEDFENYIKLNMYRYNELQFDSFEVQGNVYVVDVSLTSNGEYEKYNEANKGTGGSGYTFEWEFMVQLKDEYNFSLSFNVK